MDREERAKQFMPFAALKGYPEALQKEEKILEPRVELSEEYQDEMDRKLRQLQSGDFVRVEYYRNNAYHRLSGIVEKVNKAGGFILIADTKIPFDRLYHIDMDISEEAAIS